MRRSGLRGRSRVSDQIESQLLLFALLDFLPATSPGGSPETAAAMIRVSAFSQAADGFAHVRNGGDVERDELHKAPAGREWW
jgi:hypothetical protein